MESDDTLIICHNSFLNIAESLTLARLTRLLKSQVIGTEDHILCRNGNRTSVRRLEEVVSGKHEESCFSLCLSRKRNVNSHLVTVEVSVESCTNERMKLNGTTLNKYRLKCLNTESVKCRCTVEHYRMILDNDFKCIPNLRMYLFNHLSCRLNVACLFCFNKALHNEGLEKLKCHFLRETALIELKLRTDNDNRTA